VPKPKARLYLRFRMPDGRQSPYCPALYDDKPRIRPFWCLVKGTPEHHPHATYYKRVKREGKWRWESVGNDANTASAKSHVPLVIATKARDKEAEAPTTKDGYRIDDEIAYTRQELEDLFRASDEEEKFLWRFFLGTGFRETKVSVAEVTDLNRDTKTIRVDEKPLLRIQGEGLREAQRFDPGRAHCEDGCTQPVRFVLAAFREQRTTGRSPAAHTQAGRLRRRSQLRQVQGNGGGQGSLVRRGSGVREMDSAPLPQELRDRPPQRGRQREEDTEVARALQP